MYPGYDFADRILDGRRDLWFMPAGGPPLLSWQTDRSGLIAIPAVTGLPPDQAEEALALAGFTVRIVEGDFHRSVVVGQTETYVRSELYGAVSSRARAYSSALQEALRETRVYPREFLREVFTVSGIVVALQAKDIVASTQPTDVALPGSVIDVIMTPGPYEFATNPGDGSPERPFEIDAAGQLDALAYQPDLWDCHFALTADLDMSAYPFQRSLIGDLQKTFSGNFDGRGHTIRGLTIDKRMEGDPSFRWRPLGLFGVVDTRGAVTKLHLKDTQVLTRVAGHALSYLGIGGVAALAGINHGRVASCSASGKVEGDRSVGGLVGINTGTILACVTNVAVEGTSAVGGVVGLNTNDADSEDLGTIAECHALGTVEGVQSFGDIVGLQSFEPARRGR